MSVAPPVGLEPTTLRCQTLNCRPIVGTACSVELTVAHVCAYVLCLRKRAAEAPAKPPTPIVTITSPLIVLMHPSAPFWNRKVAQKCERCRPGVGGLRPYRPTSQRPASRSDTRPRQGELPRRVRHGGRPRHTGPHEARAAVPRCPAERRRTARPARAGGRRDSSEVRAHVLRGPRGTSGRCCGWHAKPRKPASSSTCRC